MVRVEAAKSRGRSQFLLSLVVKSTKSKIHEVVAGPPLEAAAVGPWVDLAVVSGGGKPKSSQCPVSSTLILGRAFLRRPSSLAAAVELSSGLSKAGPYILVWPIIWWLEVARQKIVNLGQ